MKQTLRNEFQMVFLTCGIIFLFSFLSEFFLSKQSMNLRERFFFSKKISLFFFFFHHGGFCRKSLGANIPHSSRFSLESTKNIQRSEVYKILNEFSHMRDLKEQKSWNLENLMFQISEKNLALRWRLSMWVNIK